MHDQAFLDAIIAAPEEDSTRLVYADWLDEQGDGARAEFIRVQCEVARKARFDPTRLPLRKREQEILKEHGADWAKPVAGMARDFEFHRGFVDTVAIGARQFLTHGGKLFRLAPIRQVNIVRLGSSKVTAADLASCKWLPQLRGLGLQGTLESDELTTLLTAPGLKSLTTLTLDMLFRPEALDPLIDGCLPNLATLNLGIGGSVVTTRHVERLAKASWAAALRHLNLRDHSINVGGVQAIAGSSQLQGLTSLVLNHSGVGLAGTKALADSPNLPNLTTLDLRRNRLTDSAARALGESRLPALTELYLGMNEIGPAGASALAAWPGLAHLRMLHLYSNPIGDDGVCALAASPFAANLWHLDVTKTGMGDRGARALAESPYLKTARVGAVTEVG